MARVAGRLEDLPPRGDMNEKRLRLFSSFKHLDGQRRLSNNSPPPILDREIIDYAQMYGGCGYPVDLFVEAIRILDNDYIQKSIEKIERKNEELRRKNKHG